MIDVHFYGDCVHEQLVSVRDEGGSEVQGASNMQYCISLAEARVKGIVNDRMVSQYLPKQSRPLYVRYMGIGLLKKKTSDMLPL